MELVVIAEKCMLDYLKAIEPNTLEKVYGSKNMFQMNCVVQVQFSMVVH